MKTLMMDIEAYSGADLAKCGAYRYAEDPDFEVLLLACRLKRAGALANKSLNTCCFIGKVKCPHCDVSYCTTAVVGSAANRSSGAAARRSSAGAPAPSGELCPHAVLD